MQYMIQKIQQGFKNKKKILDFAQKWDLSILYPEQITNIKLRLLWKNEIEKWK